MKRILLVSPDSDNEGLWVSGEETAPVANNMIPIGLATIAALTPDDFVVDIWDELVHGVIGHETTFEASYDLVGITGFKVHLPRCRELARVFRAKGIPVAIGGPGVSGTPDAYRGDFDILFIGEAEYTWPAFLRDWRQGCYRSEYRQIEKPDLAESPMPRWDAIENDLPKYAMGCVQTTRGCPFDCEFCDVIYLFGRRSRHKPIDRVLAEVSALEKLGMRSIFFCDDEFIGDARYAKDLLRQLIPLNNSFERPLSYSTQLTMNLSRDEELLELMADANFNLVFIGIESPNQASLKETHKYQNVRNDLVADVHKILSYGIAIRSGIIVGFDHDDRKIFDIQYDFIQSACLPSTAINMLKAPLGTKLWARLRQEGRVVSLAGLKDRLGHARSYTNILPKLLTRLELMYGYRRLLLEVNSWEAFTARAKAFISLVKREPRVNEPPLGVAEALELCRAAGIAGAGLSRAEEILRFTDATAPFMNRRIKTVIVQFAKYFATVDTLIPQLDRQIAMEESGSFPLVPDDRPITVPPSFRKAYDKIFPDLHRRLYLHLTDKTKLPAALTEVFVDFLVRWGGEFAGLEAHHVAFLTEICDRTAAKYNGRAPQEFVPDAVVDVDIPVPNPIKIRLGEDVLKSVEQELFKYMEAGTGAA
jgi:Radical SAM superfamily/B12 binding domain/Domain of unknown function (DUF4070)